MENSDLRKMLLLAEAEISTLRSCVIAVIAYLDAIDPGLKNAMISAMETIKETKMDDDPEINEMTHIACDDMLERLRNAKISQN